MVNCPKCGFSQPRDQYCANCGIDMLSYRPAQKPLLQRIAASTPFQVSILAVIVAGVFLFVRFQQQSELATRIAQIENARQSEIVERHTGSADSRTESSSESPSSDEAQESQAAAALAQPSTVESPSSSGASASSVTALAFNEKARVQPPGAPSAPASAELSASDETSSPGTPTRLRVLFGEMQKPALAELVADSRGGDYGLLNFGVFPSISSRMQSIRGSGLWTSLHTSPSQPLRVNSPLIFHQLTRDETTGHNLGLMIQITPTQIDDSGTLVQIEVLRTLRDPASVPQVEEQVLPLPESFTIPRGGGAFISGSLPKRQLSEPEERLYRSINVLRVLASENYKSGVSEFVIFVEPQ